MRVDVEGERRRRVSELAADEDDVQALCNQERRERVPQVVESKPRLPRIVELCLRYSGAEAAATDVAVMHRRARERREDRVVRRAVRGGQLVLAEEPRERRHENDLSECVRSLRRGSYARAVELEADMDN